MKIIEFLVNACETANNNVESAKKALAAAEKKVTKKATEANTKAVEAAREANAARADVSSANAATVSKETRAAADAVGTASKAVSLVKRSTADALRLICANASVDDAAARAASVFGLSAKSNASERNAARVEVERNWSYHVELQRPDGSAARVPGRLKNTPVKINGTRVYVVEVQNDYLKATYDAIINVVSSRARIEACGRALEAARRVISNSGASSRQIERCAARAAELETEIANLRNKAIGMAVVEGAFMIGERSATDEETAQIREELRLLAELKAESKAE